MDLRSQLRLNDTLNGLGLKEYKKALGQALILRFSDLVAWPDWRLTSV